MMDWKNNKILAVSAAIIACIVISISVSSCFMNVQKENKQLREGLEHSKSEGFFDAQGNPVPK